MPQGEVLIVHTVDTEGPLFEPLDATFARLRERFGIDLAPTVGNLRRLQNREIDLGGREAAVADIVRPDQVERNLGDWPSLDAMLETAMSAAWRSSLADSAGRPHAVTWHCMDHVGFANNPRRRAMGWHAIFDHYAAWLGRGEVPQDSLQLHHHPASLSGDAHHMGRGFSLSLLHDETLARRIIDRHWFPAVFRPGGNIETYDISVWLEAWIPFDLANQTKRPDPGREALEAAGVPPGKVSVWQHAPTEWGCYHPSPRDFQTPGTMRRWIARCLNINARHSSLDQAELDRAFARAAAGERVLVAATNHDFRDFLGETARYVGLVRAAAASHPRVPWYSVDALGGLRRALDLPVLPPPELAVELTAERLTVTAAHEIWGDQPFLALRTRSGQYHRDNLIPDGERRWLYLFDGESIALDALSHLGLASNDPIGQTVVSVADLRRGSWTTRHWHLARD